METDKLIQALKKKLIFTRGNDFDADYTTYFCDDLAYLHKVMRDRRFTVGETDIAYRVINHWDQKGLLPMMSLQGVWRKFTFVELVWLKAIEHLRILGVSLGVIAQVADNVLRWDKKEQTYPLLEYYIVKAMASSIDPYIIVSADGKSDIGSSRDIENMKDLTGSRDMIFISLKSLLSDLGLTPKKAEVLFALSESEQNLIHKVRLQTQKQIKLQTRGGEVKEMESLYTFDDRQKFKDIRQEIIDEGGFADVTEKYVEGRKVSGEIKKRERFK